jgi:hypothetical protein
MVKTFYSLGRLNLRRETARFPTASRAEKLGSVTPLMKSEVPRYAAARLHRSQESQKLESFMTNIMVILER